MFLFFRQFRMLLHSQLAVPIAHRRPSAAAPAMAQQRDVFARRQTVEFAVQGQQAELDKMIPTAARAQLGPRAVPILTRDRADVPVRVHDLMLSSLLERRADPESSLFFNR